MLEIIERQKMKTQSYIYFEREINGIASDSAFIIA